MKQIKIRSILLIALCLLLGAISTGCSQTAAPLPTGEYELGEVLSLSLLSSSTPDFYYEKSQGTRFEITDSSFTVKGKGFISDAYISAPIYKELKLGDTLSTWEFSDENGETDDSPFYISIPEGAVGWEVLTGDGEHTGWKILMCADEMCIGRWYTEGSSGTITHCDFFARILPASGEDEPEDTAPLDPDPSAVTPPDADAEELIQWEDTVIHWYFPKSGQPQKDGFPLTFACSFDHLDATCSGGTTYAYNKGQLIVHIPIKGVNGSILRWWPYEDGEPNPAQSASLTATAYSKNSTLVRCTLLFNLIDETEHGLTYSVQAKLYGNSDYRYSQNTDDLGGKISSAKDGLPEGLAVFHADLTHDGIDETITIYGEFPRSDGHCYELYTVIVTDRYGNALWSDGAGIPHGGQNGIYLYEENGTSYLMNWSNYGISGMCSIYYKVFSLNEFGDEILLTSNDISLEFNDLLAADADALRAIIKESSHLLSNSIALASTNGDLPEWVYYSTPENPLTPQLSEDEYILWSPEEIEEMQAKAQGTYTLTGLVVMISEDYILVEDETLWATDGFYVLLRIPVADPSQYRLEQRVQITANGPLYYRSDPDEGTTVEITPVS